MALTSDTWAVFPSNTVKSLDFFFKVLSPSFDTLPLEHLSSGMVMWGLDTIRWLRENNNACFLLRGIGILFAYFWSFQCKSHLRVPFLLQPPQHHVTLMMYYEQSRCTSHCPSKEETWASPRCLLAHPTELDRFTGAFGLDVIIRMGHCCSDQFWPSGTISLGLGRKWKVENRSMKLPYTQHPSKRHATTWDPMSFPKPVCGSAPPPLWLIRRAGQQGGPQACWVRVITCRWSVYRHTVILR